MAFAWSPRGAQRFDETRCAASVSGDGWGSAQCSRPHVVEENGHRWCKQHAPSVEKARDAKREARWAAESAGRNHAAKVSLAEREVIAAALHEYHHGLQGPLRPIVAELRRLMGLAV